MTKVNFLLSLRDKLSGLPQDEVDERLHFYIEMIEDRTEEALSEEEAVAAIGSVEEIAAQIQDDFYATKAQSKTATTKRHLKAWEIVLLAIGSPLWISLLITFLAIIFSLYVSLWSIIIALWAIFLSMVACAFCSIAVGIGFTLNSHRLSGIAMIGAGLVCAGIAILMFFASKAATNGTVWLGERTCASIKKCFVRKENI